MELEPDVDPWDDTRQERGPERDNPLDGAGGGAFGASPETIGVPNVTGRAASSGTSGRGSGRLPRGLLLAIVVALLVVLASSAWLWLA